MPPTLGTPPVRREVLAHLTEDQAEILYSEKHKDQPGIPLRQALKELGIDESEVGL